MPASADNPTPYRYNAALAESIELDWQRYWDENGTFYADNPVGPLAGERSQREKFFLLDMFPYPSGKGLHVGHPLGYLQHTVGQGGFTVVDVGNDGEITQQVLGGGGRLDVF